MAPRFSIIVPYFNAAMFLSGAIESVRAQTSDDWELLLIDDGSTDAGPTIARRFASEDRRIRCFGHASKKGAAAARNLGLREARGAYALFLDADDFYLPGKLARETFIIDREPRLPALFSLTEWRSADDRLVKRERLGVAPGRLIPPPLALSRLLLEHRGDIPCLCSLTVRRDLAIEVGGFEEAFSLYEDQTLLAKIFARFSTFAADHCEAVYRQHAKSASAQANRSGLYVSGAPHAAELKFLLWLKSHLREGGIRSPDLDRNLARNLGIYSEHPRTRAVSRAAVGLRNAKNRLAHFGSDVGIAFRTAIHPPGP